jgi:hypothetical protein
VRRSAINAGNFFPTTSIVAKNVELHNKVPNLSFKFHSAYDSTYDHYLLKICPDLPLDHRLQFETRVTEPNSQIIVQMPKISRPYLDLHFRVFCTHHGLTVMPSVFPAMLDKLVAESLFCHIMLTSPFVKDAKAQLTKVTSLSAFKAPTLEGTRSTYPERQLTVKQAKDLVKKHIRVSSQMLPKWDVPVHYMDVYVVAYNSKKRTFEFAFPNDSDKSSDFERFQT